MMLAIILLAFTSIAASLFVADTIQGEATAINESGALRMRSYRIASSLVYNAEDANHWQTTHTLINEFEKHLNSQGLTRILPTNAQHPLRTAYNRIKQQWQNDIRSLFDIYLEGISETYHEKDQRMDMTISRDAVVNLRNQYFLIVPNFVDNIDYLVTLLEEDVEAKIKYLRIYQFIALALTIFLVIAALILVYKHVHTPMQQLLIAAERVRNKDFSFRTNYSADDELGRLSHAFNTMSADLSEIYSELEQRVQQKTIDLEHSNCSMELLYNTVKRLNETTSPHLTFPVILKDIKQLIGIEQASICLNDPAEENREMQANTLHNNEFSKHLCEDVNCRKHLGKNKNQITDIHLEKNTRHFTISDQNQQYGVLIIEKADSKPFEAWQQHLLESIAGHIGIAINLSQQAVEIRRMALMEERGAIARELHDSLAQSLTYMKIQVSRLQAILKKSATETDAENIITELRTGLNSAYRELRELLTTFRLKIDGTDFNQALDKTVSEFNERSDTLIISDNRIKHSDLTPNEEIHVLQLIREALSNVVQHAGASHARLTLQYTASGDIQVNIEDNGTGLPCEETPAHHYGLSIMNERAKTLNGQLNIFTKPDGGTAVELCFTSTYNKKPVSLN